MNMRVRKIATRIANAAYVSKDGLDPERGHVEADQLLLEAIEALGAEAGCEDEARLVVEAFRDVAKRYG